MERVFSSEEKRWNFEILFFSDWSPVLTFSGRQEEGKKERDRQETYVLLLGREGQKRKKRLSALTLSPSDNHPSFHLILLPGSLLSSIKMLLSLQIHLGLAQIPPL